MTEKNEKVKFFLFFKKSFLKQNGDFGGQTSWERSKLSLNLWFCTAEPRKHSSKMSKIAKISKVLRHSTSALEFYKSRV